MSTQKKRRIGTLDIFIIAAVVICAVCLILRMNGASEAVTTLNEMEMKTYTVDLSVKNVRETSVNYFDKGEPFFLEKEKAKVLLGDVISVQSNAARVFYTDEDGKTVLVPNSAVTEQSSRSDVTLSLEVEGIRNADGEFLLGGSEYLGVNKEIKIASKYIEVTATVLSITESDMK
ncbi:MAG: DUF4330 family protein [Ruminococcaceae bacterium]|nr:DUF4330 family protein [Oscillospiraceae bacterium]